MEFKMSEIGTVLGIRELARQLGCKIRQGLSENEKIIIDFSNVETISSSFADEFIAKIVKEVGFENFVKNIKIKNANNFIKNMINSSIKERLAVG